MNSTLTPDHTKSLLSELKTRFEIRKLGGTLFCDCRFNNVFTYHNGAESYNGERAFRGCLRV
jgi:hypothetical protein